VIWEQAQDIADNTQPGNVDKTTEARRTSTRNRKTTSIRGSDFLWKTRYIAWKMIQTHSSERMVKNLFKIFHQNIRGLKSKVDELPNSLLPDYPNILCLTEHHLKNFEIDNLPIDRFKLGSKL